MAAKKKLEDMTDRELMIELIESQRKDALGQKITAVGTVALFAAVLVALVILVPRVITLLNDVNVAVKNADTMIAQIQGSITELDTAVADIDQMVTNANDLVVTNTDSLNDAVQKINNINFEELNKAISDFSDTVEPLANFFNKFKN